jgi:hypothetical protein
MPIVEAITEGYKVEVIVGREKAAQQVALTHKDGEERFFAENNEFNEE